MYMLLSSKIIHETRIKLGMLFQPRIKNTNKNEWTWKTFPEIKIIYSGHFFSIRCLSSSIIYHFNKCPNYECEGNENWT